MKQIGLILALALVVVGCTVSPISTLAISNPGDSPQPRSESTVPVPKPPAQKSAEAVHAVLNKILQDVDPDDLVRVIDGNDKNGKPTYRFKRAAFGFSRVASVVNHHPGPDPLKPSEDPNSVDALHALHRETVQDIEKEGMGVRSAFFDPKTKKLSRWIVQGHIASAGEKKIEVPIVSTIIADYPHPVYNGYIGSHKGQDLYIYPVYPQRKTCASCHAGAKPDTPVSYIAHLVSKQKPLGPAAE